MCIESNEKRETRKRNEAIEKILKQTRSVERKQIKILLLGTGESGKSTFVKQMRIIHDDHGFTANELNMYRVCVVQNIIQCMQLILSAMKFLKIDLQNPSNECYKNRLLSIECTYVNARKLFEDNRALPFELIDCIEHLWHDKGVRTCFDKRNQYQLSDSAEYFFENIQRYSLDNFPLSNEDILRIRLPTTGINEYLFYIKSSRINLRIIDVGGQDNERMKWINCFEGVTSVIFLAALNEYDMYKFKTTNMDPGTDFNDSENDQLIQLLSYSSDDDDRINRYNRINRINRMNESLCLFRIITNLNILSRSSFILFLNKKDLLEQKCSRSSIQDVFGDFTGDPTDYEQVRSFIRNLFIENAFIDNRNNQNQLLQGTKGQNNSFEHSKLHESISNKSSSNSSSNNSRKTIYSHFTCATDTENIKFVFESVKLTILNKNMEYFGLH